ncbi:MAG: helix-turn-helix domain-containing protein [Dehalococcoidia bacterium]
MPPPFAREQAPAEGESNLLAEVQRSLGALTREFGAPEATLDLMFLAYLLKTSKFGYFTYGPITIDVRLIEDLVARTVAREPLAEPSQAPGYSDDCLRFLRLLSDEAEESGRRRIDELHFLVAFMKVGEGIPARVFTELGVSVEQVRSYVPAGATAGGRLYSPEEAAEYFGVHVKTVRNWIRSGRLRAHRLAGQRALRIRASDLDRLLEPVDYSLLED